MNTLVDWELARRIAHKVADRRPLPPNYNHRQMENDFEAFTAQAEGLVEAQTGLISLEGPARGKVTTRKGWIDANIKSFQRLLQPLADRLVGGLDSTTDGTTNGTSANSKDENRPTAKIMQRFAALEVGAMLGWMSTRVLGQYDLLVIEGDDHDQDVVYYVAPNIAALEWRHGFPAKEFRLWIALHEVTHRAQFTGVSWLREHFLMLVRKSMDSVSTDPKQISEALKQAAEAKKQGKSIFADGGIALLMATPEQRDALNQIMGMMSLLEGHGDVTMDRAGAEHLREIPRFRQVISSRRAKASPAAKLMRQLMGIEAKMNQYAAGERFIAKVESSGGTQLLDRAWLGSQNLPDLAEIRDPQLWISRVREVSAAELVEGLGTEELAESEIGELEHAG